MRLEQLTFTRFLAAIAIVFFHGGKETIFLTSPHTSFLLKQANIGVSYFFILSGFVLVIAYTSKKIDYKKFCINRIARIYPLYLLALLSVTLMKLVFYTKGCNPIEFSLSALVLQAWVPPYPLVLNTPGWSISVEFFFYAMFPLLMNFIYRVKSFKKVTLIVVSFWALTQIVLLIAMKYFFHGKGTTSYYLINHLPLMHLNQFMIGNLTGLFFLKIKDRYNFRYNGLGILFSIICLYFLLKYPLPVGYHNGFLAIIFVPFILFLSLEKGPIIKIMSNKILIFLGEISYGIYIIQVPVHLYLSTLFKFAGLQYSFYVHLVAVIIIAALTYIIIEKPARDFINRTSKKLLAKEYNNPPLPEKAVN